MPRKLQPLGDTSNLGSFYASVNERTLLNLAADVLAIRNHTEIKITDGPGDRQCDIHSKISSGQNHLTQSKYHRDCKHSVSTEEIGETVLGMVKNGYKRGLFVTNAKISPQAKNECLHSYPDYPIDFIDGRELLQIVISHPILRSLWYDGTSLAYVAYSLTLPVLVRDLQKDKALSILPRGKRHLPICSIQVGNSKVNVSYNSTTLSNIVFEPYYPPGIKTLSENYKSDIEVTKILISGSLYFRDLDSLLTETETVLWNQLTNAYSDRNHLAIRFGNPKLMLLDGHRLGASLKPKLAKSYPYTMVKHSEIISTEKEWIGLVDKNKKWVLPNAVGSWHSERAGWYNEEIDCCFIPEVNGPVHENIVVQGKERLIHYKRWWKESFFVLLPSRVQSNWGGLAVPFPQESYYWGDKQILCVWLHPAMHSRMMTSAIKDDEHPEDSSAFLELESAETKPLIEVTPQEDKYFRAKIAEIKFRLEEKVKNLEVVAPDKARHMLAIVDRDPYPAQNETQPFKTLNFHLFENMPSPVKDAARFFNFYCSWLITNIDFSREKIDFSAMKEIADGMSDSFIVNMYLQPDMTKTEYIVVELCYNKPANYKRTEDILNEVEPDLKKGLDSIEKFLESHCGSIKRSTRRCWFNVFEISFPSNF